MKIMLGDEWMKWRKEEKKKNDLGLKRD